MDKLAIVGSTRFLDVSAMDVARSLIEGVLQRRRPDQIVSGGAAGIDTLAATIAAEHGIELVEHLPANPRWEPEGYRQRNDLIADDCTRLMRIACRWATTYGSGYTHDRAAKQGKLCWNLTLPTNILNGTISVRMPEGMVPLSVVNGLVVTPQFARRLGWVETDPDLLITRLRKAAYRIEWLPAPQAR